MFIVALFIITNKELNIHQLELLDKYCGCTTVWIHLAPLSSILKNGYCVMGQIFFAPQKTIRKYLIKNETFY
jgi:hypothetical protein